MVIIQYLRNLNLKVTHNFYWLIYIIASVQVIFLLMWLVMGLPLYIGVQGFALLALPWLALCGIYFNHKKFLAISFGGLMFNVLAHVLLAFTRQLGGINGLSLLPVRYTQAALLGLLVMVGIFVLVLSFKRKLTFKIGLLITITAVIAHALILGTHFKNINDLAPILVASTLFAFAAKWIRKQENIKLALGLCLLIGAYFSVVIFAADKYPTLNIHVAHSQINRLASNYIHQTQYNQANGEWEFRVFVAESGSLNTNFVKIHNRLMQVLIFNEDLTFFKHLYPTYQNGVFSINYTLPMSGNYKVWVSYYPLNGKEVMQATELSLQASNLQVSNYAPELVPTISSSILETTKFSNQQQSLFISLSDLQSKQVQNLTNLGAFSYITLVNKRNLQVTTAYPTNLVASQEYALKNSVELKPFVHQHVGEVDWPPPYELGGPSLEFLANDINKFLVPGEYYAFAEFTPAGKLEQVSFNLSLK